MITADFALKIFEGFSIERWNDLVRPFELMEMDKAAEKMVLVYILGKFEEHRGAIIDWDWLMYASLFDLLKKIALCDIKSPVQRMIKREYPVEYKKINEWVAEQYRPLIKEDALFKLFIDYLEFDINEKDMTDKLRLTARIYRAAHKYSTMREFEMISVVNESFRMKKIETGINDDIQPYLDLRGLQLLLTKQRPYEFLMMIEQLRFQTRWNQTPRVPKTSVLGHSFFVAVMTLLFQRESANNSVKTFCSKRRYNNFFSALFHDLPEAVTRDIISPVKQATDGLPMIVKNIEDEIVHKELLPLMEPFYADELIYFTSDEFENRIRLADGIHHVSFEELNAKYNDSVFSPADGRLVRCADHFAAFLEADRSIRHGITSTHLVDGRENIMSHYKKNTYINGIDMASFLQDF